MYLSDTSPKQECDLCLDKESTCGVIPCKAPCSEGASNTLRFYAKRNPSNQSVADESLKDDVTNNPFGHLVRPRTLPIISDVNSGSCFSNYIRVNQKQDHRSSVPAITKDQYHYRNASDDATSTLVTTQQTQNKNNTFEKLSKFFLRPNQAVIVVDLLKDHLVRGLVSPSTMASDLQEFSLHLDPSSSHQAHLFIHSSFVALAAFTGNEDHLTKVVQLISHPLFSDVYLTIFGPSIHNQVSRNFLLEIFLKQGCAGRVMFDADNKFMDMKLGFGESPLISALRHRDVETTYLLLKYGASTQTLWLGFQQAIEVLLFSPNLVIILESDLTKLRLCLPLIVSASPQINWKHIEELLEGGYCVLDRNWSEQVKLCAQINSPPALKHIGRAVIRKCLNWNLPSGIDYLQIPMILKRYLQLPEPS